MLVLAAIVAASCGSSGAPARSEASSGTGPRQPSGVPSPPVPDLAAPINASTTAPTTKDSPQSGASDGVTSMYQNLSGGTYLAGIPFSSIAGVADFGLDVSVVDIKPAVLNTATGEWDPPADTPAEQLHEQWGRLAPLTVVNVRINRVLGARPDAPQFASGEVVEVWFVGGSKILTIGKDVAIAAGLAGDLDQATEDAAIAAGAEPVNPPVTGPLTRTISMAHSLSFREGDDLLLFGRMDPFPYNTLAESSEPVLWSLAKQGAGVFVVGGSDGVDAGRGTIVPIEELTLVAQALNSATEPSQPFRGVSG